MVKLNAAVLSSLLFATAAYAQAGRPMVSPGAAGIPGAPASQISSATSAATAQPPDSSGCQAQAVDKNGKPLTGRAKKSFVKKCMASAK